MPYIEPYSGKPYHAGCSPAGCVCVGYLELGRHFTEDTVTCARCIEPIISTSTEGRLIAHQPPVLDSAL